MFSEGAYFCNLKRVKMRTAMSYVTNHILIYKQRYLARISV